MATATKKLHPGQVTRGARDVSKSAALEFSVYQDNGDDYHWEIVGASGERLAQSGIFASHDDAERAAHQVHDGAGSARFEPLVAEQR